MLKATNYDEFQKFGTMRIPRTESNKEEQRLTTTKNKKSSLILLQVYN